MTLEELHDKLRKMAAAAGVEELYLELTEAEIPTDPDTLTYGVYRECVGVERGKQIGFSQALTVLESYMWGAEV